MFVKDLIDTKISGEIRDIINTHLEPLGSIRISTYEKVTIQSDKAEIHQIINLSISVQQRLTIVLTLADDTVYPYSVGVKIDNQGLIISGRILDTIERELIKVFERTVSEGENPYETRRKWESLEHKTLDEARKFIASLELNEQIDHSYYMLTELGVNIQADYEKRVWDVRFGYYPSGHLLGSISFDVSNMVGNKNQMEAQEKKYRTSAIDEAKKIWDIYNTTKEVIRDYLKRTWSSQIPDLKFKDGKCVLTTSVFNGPAGNFEFSVKVILQPNEDGDKILARCSLKSIGFNFNKDELLKIGTDLCEKLDEMENVIANKQVTVY